ncbi:MAG TPA: ATP-binding protein [Gemmataceae bacterium]|jgi:signal transduction histidine kinase|nr:ATP-binding protein [Gemmataceae bacterium]
MATVRSPAVPSRWELAAEAIAVKIRWFGLIVGYVLVNVPGHGRASQPILNAILALGAIYTLFDTFHSFRGRIFLGRYPLCISMMEALFVGILCYYDGGLESSFRYYYLLSLICCAIRNASYVTYATFALHCISYTALYLALPREQREPLALVLMLVVLGWVTWAADALSLLLKRVSNHLVELNAALQENQAQLEARIAERTRELQESQAHVLHQEKMAAFGLLAAGIAHEVGNPLTSISSLVQMLQRRDCDDYTREKLSLVSGQLQRIQTTLRELINFSRPASTVRTRFTLSDIVEEGLNIAKYYKRTKGRVIEALVPSDLPPLHGVRDQLVQVFLNLVLNAVDATDNGGRITISAKSLPGIVRLEVSDNGSGIGPAHAGRIFEPYFTTKKYGTGLGLFVTRKLVEEHGGSVAFESKLGEGTVFWVQLPCPPEANRPAS